MSDPRKVLRDNIDKLQSMLDDLKDNDNISEQLIESFHVDIKNLEKRLALLPLYKPPSTIYMLEGKNRYNNCASTTITANSNWSDRARQMTYNDLVEVVEYQFCPYEGDFKFVSTNTGFAKNDKNEYEYE